MCSIENRHVFSFPILSMYKITRSCFFCCCGNLRLFWGEKLGMSKCQVLFGGLSCLRCLPWFRANIKNWDKTPVVRVMPWSHQTFRSVQAVKFLGIVLRNRWWPTTFLTITAEDADRWCRNCPVWSAPESRRKTGLNTCLFIWLNTIETTLFMVFDVARTMCKGPPLDA